MARFLALTAEQEEMRQIYLKEVKKRIFQSQEEQRNVNSALMLSEVLYERQLQIDFNKKLQEHKKKKDDEEAEKLKCAVIAETEEENRKKIQKNKCHQKALLEQYIFKIINGKFDYIHLLFYRIQTKEIENRELSIKKKQQEIIDNQLAIRELTQIEEYNKEKVKTYH